MDNSTEDLTSEMIVIIISAAIVVLFILIIILAIVLVLLWVCRQKSVAASSPVTFKLPMDLEEAKAHYQVVDDCERKANYSKSVADLDKRKTESEPPVIVMSTDTKYSSLQVINTSIVSGMAVNPTYETYRLSEGTLRSQDSETPTDNSLMLRSPSWIVPDMQNNPMYKGLHVGSKSASEFRSSENSVDSNFHASNQATFSTHPNSPTDSEASSHQSHESTTVYTIERCASYPKQQPIVQSNSYLQVPPVPLRHESLNMTRSYPCKPEKTSSLRPAATQNRDISDQLVHAHSDTNLKNEENSFGIYGPLYSSPSICTKAVKVLEVTHGNVTPLNDLGMGQFGQVYLGETKGLSRKDLKLSNDDEDKTTGTLVAVKILRSDAPQTEQKAFEKEVRFMSRLQNENVVRLLAVCRTGQWFMVMEYMKNGDLNSFLQRYSSISSSSDCCDGSISTRVLTYMSLQIASAMKYLASCNFIHRDLATRNCLVGENFTVKVSDFGMSKNLYDSCYYRVHGQVILPIRWMANECFYGRFSEKSDTWAFGVTMWEIFTLGCRQPYDHMTNQMIIHDAIKDNGRSRELLSKPSDCSDETYSIMKMCWRYEPKRRADFTELHVELKRLYNSFTCKTHSQSCR